MPGRSAAVEPAGVVETLYGPLRRLLYLAVLLAASVVFAVQQHLYGLGESATGAGTPAPLGAGSGSRSNAERARSPTGAVSTPDAVTVYRWVDERGTVHYESAPPPAGVEAQALRFVRDPARVSGAAGGARRPAPTRSADEGSADAARARRWDTPEGVEALLEQVGETLEALERRNETVERLAEER